MTSSATVVVLGEIARSPRMQYHALSLADNEVEVALICHASAGVPDEIARHPHIHVRALAPPRWKKRHRLPRPLYLAAIAANLVEQSARLASALGATRSEMILVQTPPVLPTLAIARAAAWLQGARLVIDWHNFGHGMLALQLGASHPLVRASRALEERLGGSASAHLTVSRAMREVLSSWGLEGVVVLHDRPADAFRRLEGEARAAARARVGARLGVPLEGAFVVVSPTSWTRDEDMGLVLDAARALDAEVSRAVVFALTGEGPGRAAFEANLPALRHVRIATGWLDAEDYRALLGAADLGVSAHRSSSGVDLPMKLLDMFGSGLPACALDYGPVLRELLHPGEDALLFTGAAQLAAQIASLVRDPQRLREMAEAASRTGALRWSEAWRAF